MKEKTKTSQYKCQQIFGFKGPIEKIQEEDVISTLKFDQTGSYICLGDQAGRVIIFKGCCSKKDEVKYEYYTQFPAHNRQFDPLNSSEISEEVLSIRWMKAQGQYLKLFTMNGKSIKLWKIFDKPHKKATKVYGGKENMFPKYTHTATFPSVSLQKQYRKNYEEELVEFDFSANEQFLLSCDSQKVTMTHIQKQNHPYLLADLKKEKKTEEIKEFLNCICIHPSSDNTFSFATNKGGLFLSDMRNWDVSRPLKFGCEADGKNNFLSQMISGYTSVMFLNNSKYIGCRDCLTVKIWDIAKSNKPIACVPLQIALKSKLCQMFQNDCIFDKFNLAGSSSSSTLLTGNYNNSFHTVDINDFQHNQYELNFKKQSIVRPILPGKSLPLPEKMDYKTKTTSCDFHPKKNIFAIASLNCFFTYAT